MTKQQLQKAKPIIFDTESVRAILDERKTAARQVIKNASPKWTFDCLSDDAVMTVIDRNGNEKPKEVDGLWATFYAPDEYIEFPMIKSKYQVGDILYVRETWNYGYVETSDTEYSSEAWFEEIPLNYSGEYIKALSGFIYKASNNFFDDEIMETVKWRPSIHMPKEAARIFLEVTGVRVERLQDMTEVDCHREGTRAGSSLIMFRRVLRYGRL